MRFAFYDDPQYKQRQADATRRNWKLGRFEFKKKALQIKECLNSRCINKFTVKPADQKKFCSRSCAAQVNNLNRIYFRKHRNLCRNCKVLTIRTSSIFCSNICQRLSEHNQFIAKWQKGLDDGNKGINTRTISGHIRRYLFEKFNSRCSKCGWTQRHPITKRILLEINHIDGNAENNLENNLELLCPNCHALTPNFRNLNRGKGRRWRQYVNSMRAFSFP